VWNRDHQSYQFILDRYYLLLRQFVISIFIRPVSLDEILEEQGTCESGIWGE